jgi:hypothetical protein
MPKPKLHYKYDKPNDIITIEGTRYSGNFFRTLGAHGPKIGAVLQITRRDDGVLWLNELLIAGTRLFGTGLGIPDIPREEGLLPDA